MTNRIIKFRAWDKIGKRWVYHRLLPNGNFNPPPYPSHYEDWQQFTGLLDKNGKEIYEGDFIQEMYPKLIEPLIATNGKKYDISFVRGAFNAYSERGDNDCLLSELAGGKIHLGEHEIIGNVWENPELLK